MQHRTCSKCGISKPETEEFFRRRGTTDRNGLRPDCRNCSKARDRGYYRANLDQIQAYRVANADKIAAYQAAYMPVYYRTDAGRASIEATTRKWRTSTVGRAALVRAAHRRRARIADLPSGFSASDWDFCLSWFGNRCAYCGQGADLLRQEHVVPVTSGGGYIPANIVPSCGSCNSCKTTKALEDWFPRQPFYIEERMAMILLYLQEAGGP